MADSSTPPKPVSDVRTGVSEQVMSLDRVSRVNLMVDLYERCSHREQVEVLERLPPFLLRDFIVLLPTELVWKIVCYLRGNDILSCLLVSKAWFRLVSSCEKYWTLYCGRIGLTPEMIAEGRTKYKTLRDLAIIGHKVRRKVKHSRGRFHYFFPEPPDVGTTLTIRPAEPTRYGYFVGHMIHPSEENQPTQYYLSIRKLIDDETTIELCSVDVSANLVILWCSSSEKHVTVYGNTGEWIRCTFPEEGDAKVDEYVDEIYSAAYYEIASCPICSMITVLPRQPRESSLWDLEVVKLIPGCPEPEKVSYTFPFLPDDSLKDNVFFQARKVVVLPASSKTCDKHGYCDEHRILFMFGGGLLLCLLKVHEGVATLETLRTYFPHKEISMYASAAALGQKLCISEDWKLAGFYMRSILYVWNMETGRERRLVNFRFPMKGYCMGVGHLFSMVYGENIIRAVCTETGLLALIHGLDYTGENPVYSPRHQEWLNQLEYTSTRLEIAVTVPEWQTAGEIAFNVANLCEDTSTGASQT